MTRSYAKMVVIPQEEYVQLASIQKAQQPLVHQFNELTQDDMNLEKVDDPYRRLQLEASNIEARKVLRDKMQRFITMSTPRPYRTGAESLFDFIEPHISYNEKGELIDKESGEVIAKSHVDDVLQHAVRDLRRRNLGKPIGWDYFLKVLRRENVPHNILGSTTISELKKSPTASVKPSLKTNLWRKTKRKIASREVSFDDVLQDMQTYAKKRRRTSSTYYRF